MHVFRDNKSAKFWLETGAIAANHGFRRKELSEIRRCYRRNGMSIATELELIKLKLRKAQPVEAMVDEDTLTVELSDGRTP